MHTFNQLLQKISEKSYGLFNQLTDDQREIVLQYLLGETDQSVLEAVEMEWDYSGDLEITERHDDPEVLYVTGMSYLPTPDQVLENALKSTLKTEDELVQFILITLYKLTPVSTERECLMPMGLLKARLIQDVYADCVKQCRRDPAKLVMEIVDKTYKWLMFQITGQLRVMQGAGCNPTSISCDRDLYDTTDGRVLMNMDLIGSMKLFPKLLEAVYGTGMLRFTKKGLTWERVLNCMQHKARPKKEFTLDDYCGDKTRAKIALLA